VTDETENESKNSRKKWLTMGTKIYKKNCNQWSKKIRARSSKL